MRHALEEPAVLKSAAIVSWFLGIGFGAPGVWGAVHFARHGEVAMMMGLPTYGNGPFEHVGIKTSVPLLLAFVVVCAAEVAVGGMIWAGAPHAAAFSYALLPFELVFWIGFALPFGPVLGIVRTVLLLLA